MILVPLEIFVSPKPCFLYRVIFLPEPRIMGGPRVTAYIVVDDWGFSRSRSCSAWSLSHLLRAILCCFVVGLLCHHIRACSPKKAIGKTQGTKVGPVERLPLFSDVTTHHSLQILAAYMMKKYSWGLRKTMEFLSSRRPGTAIWPEYSWFALIFLASFKRGNVFFFGLGSRNSNRFGVFSCARFGFEASLSSATFRLWEAGNIRKMPLGRWVFSSWDNSHVSRFFPMRFFLKY